MDVFRPQVAFMAGAVLCCAAFAGEAPPTPPSHTFLEIEDNDFCGEMAQFINAHDAVSATGLPETRNCFYIAGKLQRDKLWDIEPKVTLRAFGKPVPNHNAKGQALASQLYEPVIALGPGGALLELAPNDDRTIRIGLAALTDAFDGAINGLNQNSPHHEVGQVVVEVFYRFKDAIDRGASDGGEPEPDLTYSFRFTSGADAFRFAFVAPPDVETVDVFARTDRGMVDVCYDVDHYHITGLDVVKPYCLTVVGGLTDACEKTPVVLGWFDKNCQRIGTPWVGIDEGGGVSGYSNLCVYSDGEGAIRFAVSGAGDKTFNGLRDDIESNYFELLNTLNVFTGSNYVYTTGASLHDDSYPYVNRYPRSVWDDLGLTAGEAPETFYQHGVCGEYIIKVRLGEHVEPRPVDPGDSEPKLPSADINGDGVVNSQDLAILLSFWGMTVE
ncbi:MAG: hypothetical protein EA376_09140 [Phycisphaeraceae bacterium]|nr:MAG: hypothetical protein EA376_09140 [Phycisphaeraceae bacterium]